MTFELEPEPSNLSTKHRVRHWGGKNYRSCENWRSEQHGSSVRPSCAPGPDEGGVKTE